MANKQDLKISEARILVYLDNAAVNLKYVGAIAAKLHMDYAYLLKILKDMHEKGWLKRDKTITKSYYFLTKLAPIEAAKELKSK